MKKVIIVIDSLGKKYLIPKEVENEFESDADNMEMFDSGDFRAKWGSYRIMDFNQFNMLTDYLHPNVKSTVVKMYNEDLYLIDKDYEKLFDDDIEAMKEMNEYQKQILWNKWKKFKKNGI